VPCEKNTQQQQRSEVLMQHGAPRLLNSSSSSGTAAAWGSRCCWQWQLQGLQVPSQQLIHTTYRFVVCLVLVHSGADA
jgi:hypothetical protein